VLSFGGWYDLFPMETTNWFTNLKPLGNPQRMVLGPWWHCEWYGSELWDTLGDHQRWFDRYLKGIRNGIDTEPPIAYYVINAPKGREWKRAAAWPLPNARLSSLYFGAPAGTGVSLNNGKLVTTAPKGEGVDQVTADYTISTTDLSSRYQPSVPLKSRDAANLNTNKLDAKSLTWTSTSYARNTEITGVPQVNLWASSTANDQDFFVYLSVVRSDGSTTLVTDGGIRASNRKLRIPPYDNQGVPWHGTYLNDQQLLVPGQPVKLEFGLNPTSFMVRAGERVRVTINFYDPDWDTQVLNPAPQVSILRDKAYPSSISLPVVKPNQ
jgi:putative CocE/NonD family hydrolase